jgi:hypothetical protein
VKNLLIVVSTNRGIDRQTEECINPFLLEGSEIVKQMGCSDVALARNEALTTACQVLKEHKRLDMILMIDDDMIFTKENLEIVVEYSKKTGLPVSGSFCTQNGKFAARPMSKTKWMAGLAFLAIPVSVLFDLESKSRKVTKMVDAPLTVFTWSGEENGEWISEDFRLCKRLGGVTILPQVIGHLKKVDLRPCEQKDENKLQKFIDDALADFK